MNFMAAQCNCAAASTQSHCLEEGVSLPVRGLRGSAAAGGEIGAERHRERVTRQPGGEKRGFVWLGPSVIEGQPPGKWSPAGAGMK